MQLLEPTVSLTQIGLPLHVNKIKYIKLGNKVKIHSGFRIDCFDSFSNRKYSPEFKIEDGVIIGYNFTAFITDKLIIGHDTIIASNVLITTENHGMDPESMTPYHAQPLISKAVGIGYGCWIGQNVSILPGCNIGNKVIIAANAVVTKDIPDYTIAAGIPAKVIRKFNFDLHKWESLTIE